MSREAVKRIKTWSERCEEHPDHQERIITERMIQERMQEEIDELRQALETEEGEESMSGDHNMYQKSKGSKKGLFDDVPITNHDRDKAWEAFIKRKDVKAMMKDKKEFKFPLDGSYDLWCIVWEKAWHEGFLDGWKQAGGKTREP